LTDKFIEYWTILFSYPLSKNLCIRFFTNSIQKFFQTKMKTKMKMVLVLYSDLLSNFFQVSNRIFLKPNWKPIQENFPDQSWIPPARRAGVPPPPGAGWPTNWPTNHPTNLSNIGQYNFIPTLKKSLYWICTKLFHFGFNFYFSFFLQMGNRIFLILTWKKYKKARTEGTGPEKF